MNREDIEKLNAKEIDALVAKEVFDAEIIVTGYFNNTLVVDGEMTIDDFFPSTDVDSALKALEARCKYEIEKTFKGTYIVKTWVNEYRGARYGKADTLPLAACRSLLAWHTE